MNLDMAEMTFYNVHKYKSPASAKAEYDFVSFFLQVNP